MKEKPLGPQPWLPVLGMRSTDYISPTDYPNFVRWFHHIPPQSSNIDLVVFMSASLLAALQLAALCAADLLVELSSWEMKVKVWKGRQ